MKYLNQNLELYNITSRNQPETNQFVVAKYYDLDMYMIFIFVAVASVNNNTNNGTP